MNDREDTVDWEILLLKWFCGLDQPQKFNVQIKTFMLQWSMNKCAHMSTPPKVNRPIDNYSWQPATALQPAIAGSPNTLVED